MVHEQLYERRVEGRGRRSEAGDFFSLYFSLVIFSPSVFSFSFLFFTCSASSAAHVKVSCVSHKRHSTHIKVRCVAHRTREGVMHTREGVIHNAFKKVSCVSRARCDVCVP